MSATDLDLWLKVSASSSVGTELLHTPQPGGAHESLYVPPVMGSVDRHARGVQWVPQEGQIQWSFMENTTISFRIPPHADVLENLWIVWWLPDIYSPVLAPQTATGNRWAPYEFRWCQFPGMAVLEQMELRVGGIPVQSIPDGIYLYAKTLAAWGPEREHELNEAIGHVPELVDPAFAGARSGVYPSVAPATNAVPEPSIRARRICVPLQALLPEPGFLSILTPNNEPIPEITVHITFKPLSAWFCVRDVHDPTHEFPLVAPDFSQDRFRPLRFLQPPPDWTLLAQSYGAPDSLQSNSWDAGLSLLMEVVRLEPERRRMLADNRTSIMVRCVQRIIAPLDEASLVSLPAQGLLSALLVMARRTDVQERNEWFNFSLTPYRHRAPIPLLGGHQVQRYMTTLTPDLDPDGTPTGLGFTGDRIDALMAPEPLARLGFRIGDRDIIPLCPPLELDVIARTRGHPAPAGMHWLLMRDGPNLASNMLPLTPQSRIAALPIPITPLPEVVQASILNRTSPCPDPRQNPLDLRPFRLQLLIYVETVNVLRAYPMTLILPKS